MVIKRQGIRRTLYPGRKHLNNLMDSELRNCLIEAGLVTEKQIGTAEEHARKTGSSLDHALVSLDIVKMQDLGKCLSLIHKMPYRELLRQTPPDSARNFLSARCARRWKAFPLDYKPRVNLLTMAVSGSASAEKLHRTYRFLLDAQDVAFTVASEVEITNAIQKLWPEKERLKQGVSSRAKQSATIKTDTRDSKSCGLQSWRSAKDETATPSPAQGMPAQSKPQKVKVTDEHMEQILNSLTSAVSLLVITNLAGKTKELSRVRTSVRYCQLVAARLNLTTEQTVRIVIAAWLSALKDRPEIIKQFSSPYNIEHLIFPSNTSEKDTETLVLTLIDCYQDVEINFPDECRDVNLVRRHLHVEWPSSGAHPDIIETFLQVLMDEQFMNKFDHNAGTILLIDHHGTAATEIESPIKRAGYSIHVTGNTEEAQAFLYETTPNLILANTAESETEILNLCQQIKSNQGTKAIPLLVLLPKSSKLRGAEFLRAGADDFLSFPVDIELLYLKIEKQLVTVSTRASTGDEGVTGSLADMSFSDMLQMLSVSYKSMEITVTRGDEHGKVFLQQGNVIHAQLGDVSGENAFYKLMHWYDGKFSMKECSVFPEATITSSTMSLLMEGARLADESLES